MNAVLVMKSSGGHERIFPVRTPRTLIGRESRCHVRIALPSVSRRHCELYVADDRVHVSDLSSESGTYLNGERVERAVLTHEDQLTVGPVTFTVRVSHGNREHRGTSPHLEESKPIVEPSSKQTKQDAPTPEIVSYKPRSIRQNPSSPGSPRDTKPPQIGDGHNEPTGA